MHGGDVLQTPCDSGMQPAGKLRSTHDTPRAGRSRRQVQAAGDSLCRSIDLRIVRRPRRKCDLTVPNESCVAEAISACEKPLKNASRMSFRRNGGSADMAEWTAQPASNAARLSSGAIVVATKDPARDRWPSSLKDSVGHRVRHRRSRPHHRTTSRCSARHCKCAVRRLRRAPRAPPPRRPRSHPPIAATADSRIRDWALAASRPDTVLNRPLADLKRQICRIARQSPRVEDVRSSARVMS